MGAEEFRPKLTAILSADVQDYSLLMQDNEEAITECEKAICQNPNSLYAHISTTVFYSLSGRE